MPNERICYINLLLHRGSVYSPAVTRRTLHPSYRSYGSGCWPRNNRLQWSAVLLPALPLGGSLRLRFEEWMRWQAAEAQGDTVILHCH